MNVDHIIAKIDEIALDASLLDYDDEKELTLFFDKLDETVADFKAIGIKNIAKYFSAGKKRIQEETDVGKRQKILSFSIDYLQNFLSNLSKNGKSDLNVKLFQKELAGLVGTEQDDSSETEIVVADSTLISEFIHSTNSVLDDIEADILLLEKDGIFPEKINNVFRCFHTLKSEANLLSLLNIGKLSHKTEDLLELVRSDVVEFNEEIGSLLLEIVDVHKDYLILLGRDPQKAVRQDLSGSVKKITLFLKLLSADTSDVQLESDVSEKEGDLNMVSENTEPKDSTDFKPTIPELDLSDGTELLIEFVAEAREHLSNSEEAVLTLEDSPDDMEAVDLIFRAFHTIKGVTSFLNLVDIRILAHTSETMLDLVRNGTLKFSEDVAEGTLKSIDALRTLMSLLEEQANNTGTLSSDYFDVGPQVALLEGLIQEKTAREEERSKPVGEILIEEGNITPGELNRALDMQSSDTPNKKIGEILQDTNAVSAKEVNRALDIQAGKTDSAIKISIDKLDILVNLVGELVISETQVIQNPSLKSLEDNRLVKDLSELDRITRALQESAMSMRLVPVKSTFQKMVRIIRDLSKKAKKKINVKLVGVDTEIDKNMVEMVSDPLIHMVRNSADHGIESPGDREAKGKPAMGTITLSAFHKAGSVVIQIQDDGAGLNRDRILEKAKENGIIDTIEGLSDKRIWNLIFEPGFSTAEEVTDVSGRGVGMDVVRRNIEGLRGRIEITSVKDEGSCFSIYLPITLAIIEGIVVKSGGERYIIPISSVVEFVCPENRKKNEVIGKGEVYRFHEEVVPLVHFDKLLDHESSLDRLEERTICVCDSDYGHYCFVVDEVVGQQQVVIKNLGKRLKNINGVSGGAILGDGRVGLILDINGLVDRHRGK